MFSAIASLKYLEHETFFPIDYFMDNALRNTDICLLRAAKKNEEKSHITMK